MYYLVIIAVISLGFSLAVYQIGTNDLAFGLRRQTQRITDDFPVFNGSPYLHADRELQEGDRRLIARLILLNILVLISAGFASYALARRTLSPIKAAHQRQTRFTADVSHELRTPLTALQMESEVALLDTAASKQTLRAALNSNVEEAKKMTGIIQNLLRLGQLEANDMSANSGPIDLAQAVRAAQAQLNRSAKQRNISLQVTTTPVLVAGDQLAITQLIVILLDNAIKYSSPNSVVTMTLQVAANNAELVINDRGKGITKVDLEHVFERFYRADSARVNNQAGGYGLGLSIAKLIADSHQASISLTSQINKGTSARLVLPLASSTQPSHRPHDKTTDVTEITPSDETKI